MTGPHRLDDAAAGLEELAGLINFRVGAWQDFGYAEPPAPECGAIPPLGHGTKEECREAAELLAEVLLVQSVSEPYPDRRGSVLVRVYIEAAPRGGR